MERVILVDKLSRDFEVSLKKEGFWGGLSSFFRPEKKIIRALDKISFSLEEGELVGFIGPNGAGKTTTLKILSGLLYPSTGLVQVLGFDPWQRRPEYLKQISLVMGQKNQLWWDLPAVETLRLNQAIYEIPEREYQRNLAELTELLEVADLLDIPVRRLSLGQRMRLELVTALLHHPRILFLDEPTIGLDIVAQGKIKDFIADYNRRNKATILLTSHNMSDIKSLAQRVVIINKGRILFDGKLDFLIETFTKKKLIKLYLSGETDLKKLENIGRVRKINYPEVVLSVPKEVATVATAEVLQNFPVADLTVEDEPIEEIIKRVFKEKLDSFSKRK